MTWCKGNTQIEVGWARHKEQLGKGKVEKKGECQRGLGKAPLWVPIAAMSAQDQPARFSVTTHFLSPNLARSTASDLRACNWPPAPAPRL